MSLKSERRHFAQKKLSKLTSNEREALRSLLIEGRQIRDKFPGNEEVDFTKIYEHSPFLVLEHVSHTTKTWSIHREWQYTLAELLVETSPQREWGWLDCIARFCGRVRRIG